MKRYRFSVEAQSEFKEQIRYFDEQVTGLGDKFIQALEDAVCSFGSTRWPESRSV